jgi:hypothetical protein
VPATDPVPAERLELRNAQLGDRLFRFDFGNVSGFKMVEAPHVLIRVINGTRLAFDCGIRYWTRDGVFQSTQTVADVDLLPGDEHPASALALAMDDGPPLPLRQLCPRQHATVVGMPDPDQVQEYARRTAVFEERLAERVREASRAWGAAQAAERAADRADDGAQPLARSLALLEDNLSAAQRAQFARVRCFEVIGGETGTRYRIRYGVSMNVDQLRHNGGVIAQLCFLPGGGLPVGDVLLAQKTALELFERDALKIARRYPTSRPVELDFGDYEIY